MKNKNANVDSISKQSNEPHGCNDIGGYTFGKFFKGPKLTNISPNKTYSGMFGSFLIPMLFFLIFILVFISFHFSRTRNCSVW